MKKTSIFLSLMAAGVLAVAQSPRMSLYEEFTGENCAPCAATNPGLDNLLKTAPNPSKIIPIKWQVPIPSAPTPTWSLYKTDMTEIDWRWKAAPTGYGYAINSAPSSRIDGQDPSVAFGQSSSSHPGYLTNTVINNASSVPAPFTINMNRAWDATYSSVTLTVNIQATANYTATGALVFRLVLIEKEVHFPNAPGTNGEKDFDWVVRKSYPNLQTGTAMAAGWTSGQTQTFTINCVLPSYIVDKNQVNFVGFIQDDGNKMVQQAAQTTTVGLAVDAKATSVTVPPVACSTTLNPQITIDNNGSSAITSMTINSSVDATAQPQLIWNGNLAPGASTVITMNTITASAGSHTYSFNIVDVSGTDYNTGNNSNSKGFVLSPNTVIAPIAEAFSAAGFPAGWVLYNPDNGASTWSRLASANAYVASPAGALRYYCYNNSVTGDIDDMILPPVDLTGVGSPVFSFDHAYAMYSSSYIDKLEVMVSTNCGSTWSTIFSKSASSLTTAPTNTASFQPTVTQWTTNVINVPSLANQPQVLVKLSVTNGYGNNIWVDNVNLGSPTSIAKAQATAVNFEVYPNPTNGEANVQIVTSTPSDVTITVLNTLGQAVYSSKSALEFGNNTLKFDTKDFASGIYNIVVETNAGSSVKKLTVAK